MSKIIKSQNTFKDNNQKQPIAVKTIQMLLHEKYKDEENPAISAENAQMIQSAKDEAEKIIQAAIEEKSNIQQQIEFERGSWEQEREQLFEQVRQEGYAEGLELGRQEALRKYQSNIEESQTIINMAKNDYDETIQSAEETILALSIKVAEKILSTKLDESAENIVPLIKQGLNEVKEYENIKILVHPSHYELLLSHKDELNLLVTNETDISIYPDAELDTNECHIDSAIGRIDISIDTQLQQLKTQLLQLISGVNPN